MRRLIVAVCGATSLALIGGAALAQTFDAGSTGADGAFALPNAACPTQGTCTITLPTSGEFNYTTVNVPSGWTVKYVRNAANTPVTIRAQGNVTITGTIDVSGNRGTDGSCTTGLGYNGGAGGPGGFDGASGANGIVSTTGGSGLGPGGGTGGVVTADQQGRGGGGGGFGLAGMTAASGGGAGGAAYGTNTLLPMVGGSGGGGGGSTFGRTGGGGGGGGGSLLIASSATISLTGTILAKGGDGTWPGASCSPGSGGGGTGSGGGVRLVATSIAGSGTINVSGGAPMAGSNIGGTGAIGRIRTEAYTLTAQYNLIGTKVSIVTTPNPVVLANTPTLRVSAVGGVATPSAPGGVFARPDVVLASTTTNPVHIDLAAAQIPLGTTIQVVVRGQNGGTISSVVSTGLAGTLASSTAGADVTLPTDQPCVVSATATFDRVADAGGGPVYAEGERIERIRVSATLGGGSHVTYITASGREILTTATR